MADLTAQQIVEGALRINGKLAAGASAKAHDATDGLEALRILIREWNSEDLMVYVTTADTHALTAGTKSYTIGDGATIDTARPESIVDAYVAAGGLDHTIKIIGEKEYNRLAQKGLGYDWPTKLWYSPGYPNGTIYLWPPGGGTLNLSSIKPLSDPTLLTGDIAFPGIYDAALKWNLACEIAPEFGQEPKTWWVIRAETTKDKIINLNAANRVEAAQVDVIGLSRRFHIDAG